MLAVLVAGVMLWYADRHGTNDAFVEDFRGWIGVAVLSLGVWTAVFVRGLATVRAHRQAWPQSRFWWTWHIGAYVLFVGAVVALLALNDATATIVVPIDGWRMFTRTLTLVAGVAAGPWVLTVWLAHERLRTLRAEAEQIRSPEPAEVFAAETLDGSAISATVEHSLAVWRVIEASALALAVLVSTAVFLGGALRLALINSGVMDAAEFPASAVLGYGAFFAVVLAVAVVPLVLTWRSTAVRLVETALGVPKWGIPDQTWLDAQDRLQARLRLDTNLFRRPISALSIASPLLTALLATLVPTT
ncbi:hypothetical protein [Phytohabitans houttuyneae]|uniref:Uncharacterized protein n=1 Tax=Phytohabitans houttuyneae TaxID=1076126 RepID=A0A6V8KTI3_9ACTN|nr:hypothetical protein [Phytohabitans houttuyneae]GFJ83905.1 hypothetical protein Phou_080850 [Phytohabitans houttuyneae]